MLLIQALKIPKMKIVKSPKTFFQGLWIYHIFENLDGRDQGYQPHQLLTESDVYRRQTMTTQNAGPRLLQRSP